MIIGMNFGEREEMLALSKKRLEELKKTKHKAVLVDWDSVRVVFLTEHDPRLNGFKSGGFWCVPSCLVATGGRFFHSLQPT